MNDRPAPDAGGPVPLNVRFAHAMSGLAMSGLAMATPGCGAAAPPGRIVALSGGGDSMALLHLMLGWRGGPDGLLAATVDHGLRPESAEEAMQVARWCRWLGVRHRILRPERGLAGRHPGRGGLQAAARAMRYRLLAQAAQEEAVRGGGGSAGPGGGHILLAHTLDDQAETVVMRRARDSGPAGRAGMPAIAHRRDLPGAPWLFRPLLGVSGAELRDWLAARGIPWIDDPSNQDRRFERVRVRQALRESLAVQGQPALIGLRAIAAEAAQARRAAMDLDRRSDALLRAALCATPHGHDFLSVASLATSGPELACHALRRLLQAWAGAAYPPRRASVRRLWDDLAAGSAGATLAGVRFQRLGRDSAAGKGHYLLVRDARQALPALPLRPGSIQDWGGLFEVAVAPWVAGGMVLRELGRFGLARALEALGCGPDGRGRELATMPAAARERLPAVLAGPTLMALPTLALPTLGIGRAVQGIRLARHRCMRMAPWLETTPPAAGEAGFDEGLPGFACSDGPGVLFTGSKVAPARSSARPA